MLKDEEKRQIYDMVSPAVGHQRTEGCLIQGCVGAGAAQTHREPAKAHYSHLLWLRVPASELGMADDGERADCASFALS